MKFKEMIEIAAGEHGTDPKVARQIITRSFRAIMEELDAGRDVKIPGVCIIRSKERKTGEGKTGPEAGASGRIGVLHASKRKQGKKKLRKKKGGEQA